MPLISVSGFSSNTIESESGVIVEFDGFLNVTPSHTNVIARRPIEDGFDLSDAVHNNPTTLSVEIIVTDTAQTVIDPRAATNIPNLTGTKLVQTHTKRQINRLKKISSTRETVDMKTKYDVYLGYFLENFGYTETDEEGLRISFNLVEKQTNAETDDTSNTDDSIGQWS